MRKLGAGHRWLLVILVGIAVLVLVRVALSMVPASSTAAPSAASSSPSAAGPTVCAFGVSGSDATVQLASPSSTPAACDRLIASLGSHATRQLHKPTLPGYRVACQLHRGTWAMTVRDDGAQQIALVLCAAAASHGWGRA